jgi:hypothetical protein
MRWFQTPRLPGKHQNAAPETIRGGVLPFGGRQALHFNCPASRDSSWGEFSSSTPAGRLNVRPSFYP